MDNALIGLARKSLPVCVLARDPAQMLAAGGMVQRAGFPAEGTASPDDALERIRLGRCQIALAVLSVSEMDGLRFLERALQCGPATCVILVSARYSVDSAIEAIKRGAYDYLRWPLEPSRLARTLGDLARNLPQSQYPAAPSERDWLPLPLHEMRRIHIQRVLETCNGNRVRAARMLGIGRTSLYRFLKRTDNRSVPARTSV